MKPPFSKLADVRKALSSKEILDMSLRQIQGGSRPAYEFQRIATPFVVDTDRP